MSTYTFNFGDGSTAKTTLPQTSHAYTSPGNYLVAVNATIGSSVHDNFHGGLVSIHIAGSAAASSAGNSPTVAGKLLANSSGGTSPTAVFGSTGGKIWVTGSYTGSPTNPVFSPNQPTIQASTGVTLTPANQTSASVDATASVAASGIYTVTFVGSATDTSGHTAWQNYTWTIIAGPKGISSGTPFVKPASSGHNGQLIVYELAPGGASSEDPAIAYDTVSFEPILNVYQTLISYNGSQTSPAPASYFPEIATCVPGSPACAALYPSNGNLSDGTNFTFVISAAPQFYDPGTGANWGVYPTDVLFSFVRTMGFATLPCWQCNNGWILTQSMVSPGSSTWDGGIHYYANNTPQNMYAAITINGTDCPATALSQQHGCVTVHANAGGKIWPYFLQLVTDGLGASIVPCGWFSAPAQGAGIPYWTLGNVSGAGDHPCAAPGTTGWGVDPQTLPWTALDAWEIASSGATGSYVGNVQWGMAGSGPYYLNSLTVAQSYSLQANPHYQSNANCVVAACQPAPGHYAAKVSVQWEQTETPGEQSYQAGIADFAGIPATQAGFAIQLSQQGKIGITSFPSLSIYFMPYNMAYDTATLPTWATAPVTIPSDWFSYIGMRQLFTTAYPYQTIQQTISTKDGIQYLFNYGGVIPQFMGNYYPTNISWPSGDPNSCTGSSNQLCPQYWWSQVTSPLSPYYDPEAAGCTPSSPCKLVSFGQLGAPDLDQRFALWNSQISAITGGAIQVVTTDLTFHNLVVLSLASGPYLNPMPLFNLGWAPDYPDPTDYVGPMYGPDATYTASDTVLEQLTGVATFNTCSQGSPANYGFWSNPTQQISTGCQGSAYSAMLAAMATAASTPPGPQRVLLYNMVESIANKLALYTYYGQANEVYTYASWIDPTTINSNPTIGGGGDILWFSIGGSNVW